MRVRLELVIAAVALTYLLFIARLVRRRQLREKYALLWMGVGATVVLLSFTRGLMDRAAQALGIGYPPSILFLLAVMFLLAVAAHLSWEVSRLEEKTRRLAEEIALMRPQSPSEPTGDEAAGSSDLQPGN